MTRMKKLASILLALVMVMASTVAFASEVEDTTPAGYTLTLNGKAGHTYEVYQIFTGDLVENEDNTSILSNIVWGTGVSETGQAALGNAADKANSLTSDNVVAFSKVVDNYLVNPATMIAGEVAEGSTNCTYTLSGLAAGYYLIKDKDNTQEGEYGTYTANILKVLEDEIVTPKDSVPSVDKTVSDDDANIGDTVTFTLEATLGTGLSVYDTYKVVFHDTLSAGLAYAGNLKVTIDGTEIAATVGEGDAQVINYTAEHENGVLTVTLSDVLALGATNGSKIVVTYDAIVDDDAVIGKDGNDNKVYLEYSNDPNWDGTGDEPTGDTPEDEVKVYTWEIPVYKYTQTEGAEGEEPAKTPLAGAGFTLYKNDVAVNLVATDDPTVYKVCTQTDCTDHTHVTEIVTGETGKFQIEGLEQGTYVLRETTTPAGYNTCADVTVVIGENGVINATAEHPEGESEVGILNQSGATLPETGGVGTTMLYVGGGLLIVAALVLLMAKRRTA